MEMLSDAIGTCKLEKNIDVNQLDKQSKAMQESLAQEKGKTPSALNQP